MALLVLVCLMVVTLVIVSPAIGFQLSLPLFPSTMRLYNRSSRRTLDPLHVSLFPEQFFSKSSVSPPAQAAASSSSSSPSSSSSSSASIYIAAGQKVVGTLLLSSSSSSHHSIVIDGSFTGIISTESTSSTVSMSLTVGPNAVVTLTQLPSPSSLSPSPSLLLEQLDLSGQLILAPPSSSSSSPSSLPARPLRSTGTSPAALSPYLYAKNVKIRSSGTLSSPTLSSSPLLVAMGPVQIDPGGRILNGVLSVPGTTATLPPPPLSSSPSPFRPSVPYTSVRPALAAAPPSPPQFDVFGRQLFGVPTSSQVEQLRENRRLVNDVRILLDGPGGKTTTANAASAPRTYSSSMPAPSFKASAGEEFQKTFSAAAAAQGRARDANTMTIADAYAQQSFGISNGDKWQALDYSGR